MRRVWDRIVARLYEGEVTLSYDGELIDADTGETVREIVIETGEEYHFKEQNGSVTICLEDVWYE